MGRSRDIAKFLSSTEAENTNNNALLHTGSSVGVDSAQVKNIGIASYDTLDSLPMSGLVAGQQAFVDSARRLYISNGSGWFNVAVANATPQWDSGGEPDASYEIADSATPLVITARAIDSDNSNINLLNQSFVTDSAQYMVDISNDSSVFTFTPKSADSIGIEVASGNLSDSNGDFVYTFKWSDGINFVSKAVTITYNTVSTGVALAWGGIRGFVVGGQQSGSDTVNQIEYFNISTGSGNSTDFGDLTVASAYGSSSGNKTRSVNRHGLIAGQNGNWDAAFSTTLDYFVCATTGNATDFGDTNLRYQRSSSVSNGTRSIFGLGSGGTDGGSYSQANTAMDYVTIDTTSNTTSFGNLTVGRNGGSSTNDDTRGIFIAGYDNTPQNVIDYITMDTTGNATDFGDTSATNLYSSIGTVSNNTIGLYGGGYYGAYTRSNVIEKITIQTTGNSTDFGDLARGANELASCADGTTGIFIGGFTSGSDTNKEIQKVTIDTSSNASTFGDISAVRWGSSGVSGNAA